MAEIITRAQPTSTSEALKAHLRDIEVRKRKLAKSSTLARFRGYRKWIARVGEMTVADFNNAHIRDFIAYLSANQLSPKTVGEVSGLLKSAIASIVNQRTGDQIYLRKWNAKVIDAPEVTKQRQPIVTAPELEDSIAGAFQAGYKLDGVLWALAAGCGARVGELRSLRIGPNETTFYWSPDDSSLTIRTSV
jgi:integrase